MDLLKVLKQSVIRWWRFDMLSAAAALSYYAPLAIIPLLLVSIKVTAVFYGETFTENVLTKWGSGLGADLLSVIKLAINNLEIETSTSGYPFLATALVLGISVVTLNLLGTSFQRLWEYEEYGLVNWLKQSFRSFLFILIIQIYLIISFGFEFAMTLTKIKGDRLLAILFVLFSSSVFFYLIFRYLVKNNLEWKGSVVGAVFTAILFVSSKGIINFYIKNVTNLDIFGGAGLMLALLFWIFALSLIIYLGAAIAKEYDIYRRSFIKNKK